MKFLLAVVSLVIAFNAPAQLPPMYVAAKAGLNMREKPDRSSKVLQNIPYGVMLAMENDSDDSRRISTEGMTGYWRKVSYKNASGYIIDSYLLPFAPPAPGVATMSEYIASLWKTAGDKLIAKNNTLADNEASAYELHKQLFVNGAEVHNFQGYEYGSFTYFIPGLSMQEGYVLLRLIPEFAEVFGTAEPFPTASRKFKKGEYEYSITIDKEYITRTPWIKKISVEYESGVIYSFEMYQIDTQLVIFFGSGV